jgi:spermidine/putrescine transport system ATP-binding protein
VRPEKLQVRPSIGLDGAAPAATGNTLPGRISDTSYIGVSTQYLVALPWGQELTVVRQNDGSALLRPGEEVVLSWDPAYTFGLDASQDALAGAMTEEGEPIGVGAS